MPPDPLSCPRCGAVFAIVVGEVGPCEPCQGELAAELEARREARAVPHPCAACGRELVGRRYCDGTCRKAAWRRRTAVA